MVQTREQYSDSFFNALRSGAGFAARLMIGLMLVIVAGLVALMTAIAGVTLAAAALAMRFAAKRQPATARATGNGEGVTLEARRTPRGWTVE